MLSASAHHPGEAIRPGAGPARKIVSAYALRQAGSTGTHKANERPRRASASPPTRNAHPRRTSDAPPKRSVRPRDLVKVGKRSAARCRPGRMPQPEHGCMAPPHKCRTPSVSGGRGWLIGSTEGQSLLFCLQKTRPTNLRFDNADNSGDDRIDTMYSEVKSLFAFQEIQSKQIAPQMGLFCLLVFYNGYGLHNG